MWWEENAELSRMTSTSPVSSHQDSKIPVKSFRQKTVNFFRSFQVEPAFFLFTVCYGMEFVALTNFWVDKVCSSLYSGEICVNLNSRNYPTEQDNVQQIVNKYKASYAQWIQYFPAIIVVLILGAWCDIKDRKLALVLPLFGYLLRSIGMLLNNYFWSLSPKYILLTYIPLGIAGGMNAYILGYSSYIGAMSSERSITLRFTILHIILLGGIPFGKAITAILFARYSYVGVFGCVTGLYACNLAYSIVFLEKHPRSSGSCSSGTSRGQTSIARLLSPSQMIKTLSVPFKKRVRDLRIQVLGHLVIIVELVFDTGIIDFHYLYTRKRFGWNLYTFTTWSELSTPCAGIGTLLLVPLLSYKYKVEDGILGLMGGISYMFTYIIIGTAPAGWVMYVALGASIMSGICFVASRGALSKLVEVDELGAIFAVVAIGESVVPMLSGPFFTLIYNATLELYPGTIYLVTSGIFIFLCCLYVFLLTRPYRL